MNNPSPANSKHLIQTPRQLGNSSCFQLQAILNYPVSVSNEEAVRVGNFPIQLCTGPLEERKRRTAKGLSIEPLSR